MEGKIKLEIITPYGMIFSDEVDEMTARGTEGEFGVLPGHAPYVTTLEIGILSCKKGSEMLYFFVNWGYAEVSAGSVSILADSAEKSEEIDLERAVEAKKRAEEMLRKTEEIDFARATAAIDRAVMRIQIAEKHQTK